VPEELAGVEQNMYKNAEKNPGDLILSNMQWLIKDVVP